MSIVYLVFLESIQSYHVSSLWITYHIHVMSIMYHVFAIICYKLCLKYHVYHISCKGIMLTSQFYFMIHILYWYHVNQVVVLYKL